MSIADLSGKTVLVTGGAGFVGSHIVEALTPDNEVRVLDNFSGSASGTLPDGVQLLRGDIRDVAALATAMDGVDVVFHEAALIDVRQSIDEPWTTHDVNCTGTLRLLECARETDARVVLASSSAVYGQPESLPIAEDHPLCPTSPYGLQKLSLDRYAALYHDLYGVETVALRYFNVYGPRGLGGGYSGVIGTFINRALADQPLVIDGDGTQSRDFVHVDDVVQANLLAATTDRVGEAYNVGTGESVSIRELASMVVEITGTNAGVEFQAPRPGDIDHSEADISKAQTYLGFEPTIDLCDGLARLPQLAV